MRRTAVITVLAAALAAAVLVACSRQEQPSSAGSERARHTALQSGAGSDVPPAGRALLLRGGDAG